MGTIIVAGREVKAERLPADNVKPCADCGQAAKYIITEADGHTWLYCGICEIG